MHETFLQLTKDKQARRLTIAFQKAGFEGIRKVDVRKWLDLAAQQTKFTL